MAELNPYKTLSSKVAYQTPFMTVIEDQIQHPDGKPGVYSYTAYTGAVVVVPINDQGQVYLVRVWRYPISRYVWEVPMGGLDNSEEQPLAAAKRELMEEAGISAQVWTPLATVYPNPSASNELVTHFLAQQLSHQSHTDTNEISEVKAFSFDQIFQMIEQGDFVNGEAITSILLAYRQIHTSK